MKRDGLLKTAGLAFGIALILYALAYPAIEHRRNRLGPWQVTFTQDESGNPAIIVNQAALAITNVQIIFKGDSLPNDFSARTIAFDDPKPVPYPVPFGECLFMDTTFLPGTIALDLFGHEIELIPRVLTVDKAERRWQSNETIQVEATERGAP